MSQLLTQVAGFVGAVEVGGAHEAGPVAALPAHLLSGAVRHAAGHSQGLYGTGVGGERICAAMVWALSRLREWFRLPCVNPSTGTCHTGFSVGRAGGCSVLGTVMAATHNDQAPLVLSVRATWQVGTLL